VLPLLLLIVVVGGAVWLFIMYQGRMMLILAQKGIALPYWFPSVPQGWQQPEQRASRASETKRSWAEQDPAEALQRYAAVHNLEVRQENGYYLLVDRTTHQVVKQLTLRNW
jgi:hypothetical protein